jgi:hypothetical protein
MTELKLENLLRQDAEELSAEQAEETQGGKFALELDNIVRPKDASSTPEG